MERSVLAGVVSVLLASCGALAPFDPTLLGDGDGDTDADTDTDTDTDADGDGDGDADTDADGDTDSDTDSDADGDADPCRDPSEEVCNGVDDDCDGEIDEHGDCWIELTRADCADDPQGDTIELVVHESCGGHWQTRMETTHCGVVDGSWDLSCAPNHSITTGCQILSFQATYEPCDGSEGCSIDITPCP